VTATSGSATSGSAPSLSERTSQLVAHAQAVYRGTPDEHRLLEIGQRLRSPLRVAVAGRVKSGKSTLLNALIGERLAATDAGECTRVVTWYADGHTYRVTLTLADGSTRPARFGREDDALDVDLGGLDPDQLERIDVTWPSRALRRCTLVDTPGIGSLSEQLSRRAWDLLADAEQETPADAVLYLMKHLHRDDLEFLAGFHDTEVSRPHPVNAIGVLSRADEIAAGRLDAMESADRIARRLAADPNVRRVAQTVVPVAGLLAQTATTLTEHEVKQLRMVAEQPARVVELLLLSADRFVESEPGLGLTSFERQRLLERLGLFGIRLAAGTLRQTPGSTASELARDLATASGLNGLHEVLGTLFLERSEVLKSRSALLAVDALTRRRPVSGATALATETEQIMAGAHPFHELRVLSSLRAGWVAAAPEVLADLERVVGGAGQSAVVRLGLPPEADRQAQRQVALQALLRWQRRAESPMSPRELVVAARVAIRSCEGLIADLERHHPTCDHPTWNGE
jgi:50S ribosome-binding GTPase